MKKILLTIVMAVSAMSAFAQFEAGKQYIATNFEGFNLSYSEAEKTSLGLGANYGFFFEQDWLLVGEAGFDYHNSDLQKIYLGAAVRYYIEQNGLFLQAGAKYVHKPNYNDLAITPELGYCFFLNHYLAVEPAAYFDISLSDFSNQSKFGVKIGLAWYF